MKTLTLTAVAVAVFTVGYIAGKSKKQVRTTPVVRQEEPEGV